MINKKLKDIFRSAIKGKICFNRQLKDYTYFRIGGPASAWTEPVNLNDLQNILLICKRNKLPIFVFGGGSNLLVDDKGTESIVIRLSSPFFKKIDFHNNQIACGSGAGLRDLIRASIRKGLAGLEFLAGIPGTVGGAVAMNAGSPGESIGRLVERITAMDYRGRLIDLKRDRLKFGYRKSSLFNKIILQVHFRLKKSNPRLLEERFNKFLEKKRDTQKMDYPNAGCIFKNPSSSKRTTAQLIESAGLVGKRIGDAQFSKVHANFIVNLGKATSGDVKNLIRLAQDTVKERYNLWLEPEVRMIG